jgi:hypothetical protein
LKGTQIQTLLYLVFPGNSVWGRAGFLPVKYSNQWSMLQRDGSNSSLWQANTKEYIVKNKIARDQVFDVIIVGGGITGISTALLLQREGKKCCIFEAHDLCFGTTGGTTAHLNTVLDTPNSTIIKNFGKDNAVMVAKAAREAIDLIKKNIKRYSINCAFEETSAFLFSQNKDQTKDLQSIEDSCRELRISIAKRNSIPIPIEHEKVIEIKKQAKFNPTFYVMALAAEYEKEGGFILKNCRVHSAENTDPVTVQTSQGVFRSHFLIYATHIPPGINILNFRCAPYRSYAMAVRLSDNKYPEELIYDMYEPYHYYRTQKIGQKNYFIVGGEDHKTGHEQNTESCFQKLESHIRKYFKVKEIPYRWSSQYFEPVDGLPYIGHMPGKPGNILVATGYGGNGMIYSQVASMLLKEIIQGNDSAYGKLFDPNRIKPVAGFTNFVKENVSVAKDWLSKLLPKEKLEQFADVAPGEAKVVKVEGEAVALYKDENGSLHAINPTCTHMKCHVAWNSTEKTWDCPCHGARYSADGQVLNGPADIDLEKVNLAEKEKA